MSDSPKENEEKLRRTLNAWKTLANGKVFGMTLDEYEAAINPSFTSRQQLDDLDNQRTHLINTRTDADEVSLAKTAAVVASVIADPAFGPDSSLYEAMGYKRKSERASGLTRGKKTGPSGGGTPKP
jgi:hypothetical protein